MNKELKQIGGGLLPLKKDNRDFSFGKAFGTIDLTTIPANFVVGEPKQKDQGNTDFCTAFSTTSASELQEGVELNPYWQFAVSKMISGNPDQWGQNIRDALKVHTKYGAIKKSDFNREDITNEKLRYIENYPKDLFDKAKVHRKKSYFRVD